MRNANGLGSLSIDSSLMACAQSTAETMAASNMSWHIGNVSGRASSFGYNNYNTCFATENFMVGSATMSISQIQAGWADASHMIPMQSSSYCHIGAGVAAAGNGMYYYVVQAAYPAGVAGCSYVKSTGSYANTDSSGTSSLLIRAVVTATPNEDGVVYHTVDEGQTLWSISEAYNVTVADIQGWNNMYNSTALNVGQTLYIPSQSQSGKTPTPQTALTVFPTADANGRFYHVVGDGDTLWAISELWNVPLNSIYQANGLTADDSIGLGWEIAIPVTATPTLLPTNTPTLTVIPSETPTPALDEMTEHQQTADNIETGNTQKESSLLHAPDASARTYIIVGIIGIFITGGGIIAASLFMKKK